MLDGLEGWEQCPECKIVRRLLECSVCKQGICSSARCLMKHREKHVMDLNLAKTAISVINKQEESDASEK